MRTSNGTNCAGRCAGRSLAALRALLHGMCLAVLVLPPPLLRPAPARATQGMASMGSSEVRLAEGMVASETEIDFARSAQAEFAAQVADMGLAPIAEVQLSRMNDRVSVATSMAAAPMQQRLSPYYFQLRNLYAVDGGNERVAATDLIASYAHNLLTFTEVTRFSDRIDDLTGKGSHLAGMEIRRTTELEVEGFDAFLESVGPDFGPEQLPQVLAQLNIDPNAAVETVALTWPDGTTETHPAGEMNLAAVMRQAAGGDCVGNCFSDAGLSIGLGTAACIATTIVGCIVICGLTAIGCYPCVSGTISLCGVLGGAAGGGALVGCVISCLFPPGPTPVPTPTRALPPRSTFTPTPTFTPKPTLTPTPARALCHGDCNGDGRVTVDELVGAVGMALSPQPNGRCGGLDTDGNQRVSIDELIAAVGSALNGCNAASTRAELLVSSTGSARVLRYDIESGGRLDALDVGDAGFSQPRGLALGADGNLYVAVMSGGNEDAVVRFDVDAGSFVDVFVRPNSGKIIRPEGLIFGPEGDLYGSSRNQGQVQVFDASTGAFIQTAAIVFEPRGLVFGPDGLLYVSTDREVRRFDVASRVDLGAFIAAGSGGLHTDTGSTGLAFGPDGHLYVSSSGTDSVLRYDGQTGRFLDEFVTSGSGGLDNPVGLAFGPDGKLYVASNGTDSVLRYDAATGAFLDAFVPAGNGGLQGPTYLVVTERPDA